MTDDDCELSEGLVCYCFKVTGPTLRALAERYGITRYEEFAPYTNAGQGCRGCRFEIEAWLAMRARRGDGAP